MNITSNVAQPSFKATLKQNKTLRLYENDMNEQNWKDYNNVLKKLEKVSPGDVLELYSKDDPNNPYAAPYTEYFIRNPKKKHSDIKIYGGYNCKKRVHPKYLIKTLSNIVTPNTRESSKLLTEPATKDQRTVGEKLSDFFFGSGDDEMDFDPIVV